MVTHLSAARVEASSYSGLGTLTNFVLCMNLLFYKETLVLKESKLFGYISQEDK